MPEIRQFIITPILPETTATINISRLTTFISRIFKTSTVNMMNEMVIDTPINILKNILFSMAILFSIGFMALFLLFT